METEQIIQILKMLGYLTAGLGGWYVYDKWNKVKRSVGWKFIDALGNVKFGRKGHDIALRIKSLSGRESYFPTKNTPIIEYEVLENGKKVKKYVIYDERSVDYLNGIPILNVTPNDIRPMDRETGLLVNIPSELIDKLAVDSSKNIENEMKKDKNMKMLIYGLVGMGVLFILGLSYINQTNMEIQGELLRCTVELGKSATVIAG